MNQDQVKFLEALKKNNGVKDELTLGGMIGFPLDKTNKIILELLDLGKIEFQSFGLCSYRVIENP